MNENNRFPLYLWIFFSFSFGKKELGVGFPMKMTNNPKLVLSGFHSSFLNQEMAEGNSITQNIKMAEAQKISHVNGFQYATTTTDSFVIDMVDNANTNNKATTPNSWITLQRNLSRKGSNHANENASFSFNSNNDRQTSTSANSSKGSENLTPLLVVGTLDHSSNQQGHHHITITNDNTCNTTENRFPVRRNSFKRSSSSHFLDPKRVLLICATLSSIGTIMLIYLTLSVRRLNGEDNMSQQE